MPRKPRTYVAGMTYHVIQRGNNRRETFKSNHHFEFYKNSLADACVRHGVSVHAYVLMTNHVHLLMSPSCAQGISLVMQSLGRNYVQYFNKTCNQSGTLWEGRHKASVIETERYLLACYRYIELNPVRAFMAHHPDNYPWSSFRANSSVIQEDLVVAHPLYLNLGKTADERARSYREFVLANPTMDETNAIRIAANFNRPLGSKNFRKKFENNGAQGFQSITSTFKS